MREVTVIIPNYNGKKYLKNCLEALFERTETEMDVIVVDNASKDESVKIAREAFPQVNYLLLDKNHGFSKAVNEGIRMAKTPYVLLLNNDTEIQTGFVEALLARIKTDKSIFSVEAKMLQYHAPEKIDSAGTFYNVFGWARARGKDEASSLYQEACETFAACGGAAIYRRSVLEKLELFDETFFAYLEDVDMGYRARIYGYKNLYEPLAQVLHVGSGTSGSRYNDFKVRISARNNIYLIYKNMPGWQQILNAPFLLTGFGIKIVYFIKKGFLKPYVCGLKDGIELCRKSERFPQSSKYLRNHWKIQKILWMVKF